ncbi:MAG: hypothetical protein ACKO57_07615 [Alphaproteobacteria bacterium]
MTIKTLFLSTTLAALILVAGASATLANEHGKDHAATPTETAPAAPAEDAKKADDHSDHDKEHKDEDTKKKY